MENFIHTFQVGEQVCDDLVAYHAEKDEYKSVGVAGGQVDHNIKESTDVIFYNSSTDPRIQRYFQQLQMGYDQYIEKYNLQHLYLKTEDHNLLQHYPVGGGFKVWHFERDRGDEARQLVYMTYLNDVPDGGTAWKYQDFEIEAKKGLSVIWPSDFTHTHKGIVSHTSEKWIATGWFNYS